jgi:predicted nucleic acid-binding protein
MLVSNWAAAEFTSALGARQRNATLTPEERESAELALDAWLAAGVTIDLVTADVSLARRLMRASSTPLKAPDALHLAATRRTGATLATLDRPLQRAAEGLGLATVDFSAFG